MTTPRTGDRFREVGCKRPRVVEVISGTGDAPDTVFVRVVSGPRYRGDERMDFARRALDNPERWVRVEGDGTNA